MEPLPLIVVGVVGVVALLAIVGLVRSVMRLIFAAVLGVVVAGLAYVAAHALVGLTDVPSVAFLVVGVLATLFALVRR